MIMIGCDFHPGLQQISLLDTESGRREDLRLSHDGAQVRQFYATLPRPVRVGLESSGYSLWFEELLEELGCELWVGDPAGVRKAAPRKQKTDRNDARLLLQLLEENRFPRIWGRETRDLRQLLMHRHKLVAMRTAIKNQLQAIALNRGVQRHRKLWSEDGRQGIEALVLPPWTERRRNDLLRLLDQWDAEIAELDQVVRREAEARPDACYLLRRQMGIGPITALATVLTLGPVERFSSARKVASYAGLIPVEHSSGPRQRLGHLSKQGSPFLRFLLVEAAHTAVRLDPTSSGPTGDWSSGGGSPSPRPPWPANCSPICIGCCATGEKAMPSASAAASRASPRLDMAAAPAPLA
jgi:transposase